MIGEEARKLRERLLRIETAMSSVEEAVALSKKKNDLQVLVEKVTDLSERRRLLKNGGVLLSQTPDVDKARKSCEMILTRFTESPKAATLVDKQRWTKLTESIKELNTVEETLQKQDWKGFFSTKLFAGVSPEQRERTILMTLPENIKALRLYQNHYKRLAVYRTTVPSTDKELTDALESSRQLSEIRFVENNDVPSVVREFFNATSSGGGANLELLTTEVVNWLRSNGMIDHFAVRAR